MSRPVLGVGGVIVFEGEDGPSVCLIKRAHPPLQGQWSLPGGHVEPGETLVEAVAREVWEETGYTVDVGALVEVVEIIAEDRHYVVLDYVCRPSGPVELPKPGGDAAEAALVPVKKLAAYGVTDDVMRVVHKAIATS